jgi:hypothetical protein
LARIGAPVGFHMPFPSLGFIERSIYVESGAKSCAGRSPATGDMRFRCARAFLAEIISP